MEGYNSLALLYFLLMAPGIHMGHTSSLSDVTDTGNRGDDLSPSEEFYIDVTALIGHTVYERWHKLSTTSNETLKRDETTKNIRRYFSLLVNAVDERFKNISGNYNIRLVGIKIEDEGAGEWLMKAYGREENPNGTRINAMTLIEEISIWSSMNEAFPKSDFIITYTTFGIYMTEGGIETDLKGFSKIGTICKDPADSVSIVMYTGVFTDDVLLTVHEVAHGLGARHDDEDGSPCPADDDFIMSPDYQQYHSLEHNNQFKFSPCSEAFMQQHIKGIIDERHISSERYSCLVDQMATDSIINTTGEAPGQAYSSDVQCQLFYGEKSYFCRTILAKSEIRNVCKRMYCFNPEDELCYPINAAEGTSCGNKQWCETGVCVYSDNAPYKNDECIFGDILTPVYNNLRCSEFITPFFSPVCYSDRLFNLCCHTCGKLSSGDPGCEYGDNYFNTSCSLEQCAARRGTYYTDVCCDTCREYRTQTSTTISTSSLTLPTATTTTQSSRTSSMSGSKVSTAPSKESLSTTTSSTPTSTTTTLSAISTSTQTSSTPTSTTTTTLSALSTSTQTSSTSLEVKSITSTLSTPTRKSTSTKMSTSTSFLSRSSKSILRSITSSSLSPEKLLSTPTSSSSSQTPLSSSSSSSKFPVSSSPFRMTPLTITNSWISYVSLSTKSSPASTSSSSSSLRTSSTSTSTFTSTSISTTISTQTTPPTSLSDNVKPVSTVIFSSSSPSPSSSSLSSQNGWKTTDSKHANSKHPLISTIATNADSSTGSSRITNTSENCFTDVECNEDIPRNPSLCYDWLVYTKCCISCRKMSTWKTGCEYGDKSPSSCRGRHGYTCCGYETECCATCGHSDTFCTNGKGLNGVSTCVTIFIFVHVLFITKCYG